MNGSSVHAHARGGVHVASRQDTWLDNAHLVDMFSALADLTCVCVCVCVCVGYMPTVLCC